jgi:hypothetical protein
MKVVTIPKVEYNNLLIAKNKLLNIQNEIYDFEDENESEELIEKLDEAKKRIEKGEFISHESLKEKLKI